MHETKKYLNLGCGNRYHPDWINIDIVSRSPEVIQSDLSCGIPLPDKSCDVVYHAAMLEHLRHSDAKKFLIECYRVLKPRGIIRVGVPDLEKICQLYLSTLSAAINGEDKTDNDYDWIMLELFDQIVREKSGGDMLKYLQQDPLPNEAFVYERIGEEGRQLVKVLRNHGKHSGYPFPDFLHKLRRGFRYLPYLVKNCVVHWILGGDDKRALEIGRFRLAGEVHQWMYDRYSLARLLRQTGFYDPQLQNANTSLIRNWTSFHLDTLPDGRVIKPDLFFMEAIKPEAFIHE